jgi:anti-sigma regulatory factor (Ser/Thr protein kinase)
MCTYMHKYDLNVTVQISAENLKIPEDKAVLLFQSVRELLMNCLKYASTDKAQVSMDARDGLLHIAVRDQAKGFQLPTAAAADNTANALSSKFGLFSIAERMKALGGSFTLESAPGAGTMARLTLSFTGTTTPPQSPSTTDGAFVTPHNFYRLFRGVRMLSAYCRQPFSTARQPERGTAWRGRTIEAAKKIPLPCLGKTPAGLVRQAVAPIWSPLGLARDIRHTVSNYMSCHSASLPDLSKIRLIFAQAGEAVACAPGWQ